MDRNKILKSIQRNKIDVACMPGPFTPAKKEDDRIILFKEMVLQTGGVCIETNSSEEVTSIIAEHFAGATEFRKREIIEEYPPSCSKQKLEKLKTVILKVQFGVAENGAIWIDDSNLPNRLIPFICEELVVCLDSKQIVSNMHEAYIKIKDVKTGFGLFLSGPSKTSDIEQHLVYGAHGAKKVTVILVLS